MNSFRNDLGRPVAERGDGPADRYVSFPRPRPRGRFTIRRGPIPAAAFTGGQARRLDYPMALLINGRLYGNGRGRPFDEKEKPVTTMNGVHKPDTEKTGIAFDDEIPKEGPEIFILRLKGGRVYTFSVWGRMIRGIWVHWRGDVSEPHYNDATECPGCIKLRPKRWKGYLHCYCYEMRQEVFLELTPSSAGSLKQQLSERAEMRGARIQVKRTGADNGRLYISVLTPMNPAEPLPAEKDPRPSILKLWGISEDDAQAWLNDGGDREPENFT